MLEKTALTKDQVNKVQFIRDLGPNGFPRDFSENILKAGCMSEKQAFVLEKLYLQVKRSFAPTMDDKYSSPVDDWQYYD